MEAITNPLFLKEEASRAQVAITYGIVGLIVGVFVLNKRP